MSNPPAGGLSNINAGKNLGQPAQKLQEGWPQSVAEYEALVESCQHGLVRYAFRRLGSLQDAEDITQNVLVKSFAERRRLKNIRRVTPYLYRMLANACTDFLRKHNGRQVYLEELKLLKVSVKGADCTEEAAARELARIESLLAPLPEEQAEVIRLRVLDGLSFASIAEMLGCPLPTVKSRFRYGLDKLRKRMSKEREVER